MNNTVITVRWGVGFATLLLALSGCGKPLKIGQTDPTPASWSASQIDTIQSSCVDETMKDDPSSTRAQADSFCLCLRKEVMLRWTFTQYTADKDKDNDILIQEGEVSRCSNLAGYTLR